MEYATEVWNPQKIYLINKIEKVQKLFTKNVFKKCGLVQTSYIKRLTFCKLEKLVDRRKIADLTTTFKIIKGFSSLNIEKFFTFSTRSLRRPLPLRVKRHSNKTKNNFFQSSKSVE